MGDDEGARECLWREAVRLIRGDDFAVAAEVLGELVAAEPGSLRYQHNLAACLLELGRLKEAEAGFQQALRLAPDYEMARTGLARVQKRRAQSAHTVGESPPAPPPRPGLAGFPTSPPPARPLPPTPTPAPTAPSPSLADLASSSGPRLSQQAGTAHTAVTAARMIQQIETTDDGRHVLELATRLRAFPGHERDARLLARLEALRRRGVLRAGRPRRMWLSHVFDCERSDALCLAFGPGNHHAVSGHMDGSIRLWDVSRRRSECVLTRESEAVLSITTLDDGTTVISGNSRGQVTAWDVEARAVQWTRRGHEGAVLCLALGRSRDWVLSGGADGAARVWGIRGGKLLREIGGLPGWVLSAAVSADGLEALCGTSGRPGGSGSLVEKKRSDVLVLLDLSSGSCVGGLDAHSQEVSHVGISTSGTRAVSASRDGTLRRWDVPEWRCAQVLEPRALSTCVGVGADCRHALLPASGLVGLWDLNSGAEACAVQGEFPIPLSAALNATGCWGLSGHAGGTLRLWQTDWEWEVPEEANWDEGARPYLEVFLRLRQPKAEDLITPIGPPKWNDDDFARLLQDLGCGGYGWLRPEGVRGELEKMTADWTEGPRSFQDDHL